MSKITVEKIIPAKILTKRRLLLTKTRSAFLVLVIILAIPFLLFANSLITKKSVTKKETGSEAPLSTKSLNQKADENGAKSSFSTYNIDPTPPIAYPDSVVPINEFGDAIIVKTKDYKIVYYGKTRLYSIAIYSTPPDEFIPTAEREFLSTLKISGKTACELNVRITTPNSPNEKDRKLSFCEQM